MAISNIFVFLMCHGPWVTPSTCRCNDLHHEIELGVVLGKQARKVTEDEAMSCVGGYCLALDMTARFAQTINKKYRQFNRDFQDEAKKKGHPWTLAKVRYSH